MRDGLRGGGAHEISVVTYKQEVFMVAKVWALAATILTVAMAFLHFANPYPFIQIPDRGHRLYAVPADRHALMVEVFRQAGLGSFGTFTTAGARQTLLEDGFTVIASGKTLQMAAVSLPCKDPLSAARSAQALLNENGIETQIWTPPEKELEGRLVVLKLPSFGWDIAYRLQGKDMPWPKWE
jgi:hypothetical protein